MKKRKKSPRGATVHSTCYACGDIGPGVKFTPFAGEYLCEDCARALHGDEPQGNERVEVSR